MAISRTVIELPNIHTLRTDPRWLGAPIVLIGMIDGGVMFGVLAATALVAQIIFLPPWRKRRRLVIAADALHLADGNSLALADIRSVYWAERLERVNAANIPVIDVIASTARGLVNLATVAEPAHAGYIESLVDRAYRAFLRDRG
jgi:hypothetical protein